MSFDVHPPGTRVTKVPCRCVWKFEIPQLGMNCVEMPEGALVIHVAIQHDRIMMWAIVHPDNPMATRKFRVVGTGTLVPDNLSGGLGTHVGTVITRSGDYVWHVFDQGVA